MTRPRRSSAWFALAIAAITLPFFTLRIHAQAHAPDRAKQIGGKFMCMCGCSQVLTQCNHVGCSTSANMLKQVNQSVARGDSEESITQMFLQQFGTKVYAEPPKSGLSLVAWSLPGIYLFIGTALVLFVISRWRARPARQAASAGAPSGISVDDLERARRRVTQDTED
jgi:cytochrome c-type biogenesis protein CcmH